MLRAADDQTADALALAENFIRAPMHALDEAEAFAKLAREEAIGVESIAAEFGVSQPYVRQRMKLATLAEPVKAAYRQFDLLTVECITARLQRRTELVWRLAAELGVDFRRYWRPEERWLAGYQKIQLAHLIGELRGPVYAKAAETKKKSELVSELTKLFADAAEGRMEDVTTAAKFNAWLPSNLREEAHGEAQPQASAA